MVKLTTTNDVDWLLDYLIRCWNSIPETAAEWDSWEPLEREVFHLEWAVPRSHLDRLEQCVTTGELTPEQCHRYDALRQIIHRYTPVLNDMLAR